MRSYPGRSPGPRQRPCIDPGVPGGFGRHADPGPRVHAAMPARESYEDAVGRLDEMERRLASDQVASYASGKDGTRWESNVTKGQYESMVDAAREHILAGDAFQIVVSQRFRKPLEASAFDVYRCLPALNPSPFLYSLSFACHPHLSGTSPSKH